MTERRLMVLTLALILLTAVASGPAVGQERPAAPAGQPAAREADPDQVPTGSYYDFADIMIPKDLNLNRGESFVYDTPSFTAGVLVLDGRVEVRSLTRFFVQAMAKDNWLMAARFTTPKIVLLFEKPNKRAIVYVTETSWSTRVEIWVAPFIGTAK